ERTGRPMFSGWRLRVPLVSALLALGLGVTAAWQAVGARLIVMQSLTRGRKGLSVAIGVVIAALAGVTSAGARQVACTPAATFGPGATYTYTACGVPDLDQRRTADGAGKGGLPNNGVYYCVPTVAMDWLAYLAGRGYMLLPAVKDWTDPANFNLMSNHIKLLGGMMDTDPSSGTDQDGLE